MNICHGLRLFLNSPPMHGTKLKKKICYGLSLKNFPHTSYFELLGGWHICQAHIPKIRFCYQILVIDLKEIDARTQIPIILLDFDFATSWIFCISILKIIS